MSDNLLLTVLGAVGVGALLLGMKQKDDVREDWGPQGMLNLGVRRERIKLNKSGQKTAINFAKTPNGVQQNLQSIARMSRSGVSESAQMATLQQQALARASNQQSNFAKLANASIESYQAPSTSLGSSAVTRNDYASWPQYNQSTPLQSPSLNLPAQIRYNPPSLNNMGITEAYQPSSSMDYAGVVEGFAAQQTYADTYTGNPGQGGLNKNNLNTGYVAGRDSYLDALNQGKKMSDNIGVLNNNLPLNTMETPSPDDDETMIYDRFIYANNRNGGWRASSSGSSDLIRGDLAVNVDPCQKGWFQSSLTPADLRRGALNVISGDGSGNSNNTTASLASEFGNVNALSSQGETGRPSVLQKALVSSGLGKTATVSSFA